MKYFLDTEFYEDGKTIDLISIGIVADDGREYYAVNSDFEQHRLWMPGEFEKSAWVRDNVLPYINWDEGKPASCIRGDIIDFVTAPEGPDEYPEFTDEYWLPIEFWGYYADYDWVAFCQLFGRMIDLPRDFPKFCRDIKQFAVSIGNPLLPPPTENEHHALFDARWNKIAYDSLVDHVIYLKKQNPTINLNDFWIGK